MHRRRPAVAGQFYPGTAREIRAMLAELVKADPNAEKVIAGLAPHAGWIYSGKCAGMLYGRIQVPDTVVVMCPNHRGLGADAAIMTEGVWDLPTGPVELEPRLARLWMKRCAFLQDDELAHAYEHSLEVHLPFLQLRNPRFKLVPLSLGRLGLEDCRVLGESLAEAVQEFGEETLVVASTDMTHYESAERAKEKDNLALEQVLALNPEGLFRTVMEKRISMCGVIPVTAMLYYALARGAKEAALVDYRTSGDVTRDYSEVVAYASVMVK